MKRVYPWLIAGAAIVTGVMVVASTIANKGLYSQEAAAWVQAVGSIGAIVFAVLVHRKARLDQAADNLLALTGAFLVAAEAIRDLSVVYEDWISGSLREPYDSDRLEDAARVLREIPSFQFGEIAAAPTIDRMLRLIRDLQRLGAPEPGMSLNADTVKTVAYVRLRNAQVEGYIVQVSAWAKVAERRARLSLLHWG